MCQICEVREAITTIETGETLESLEEFHVCGKCYEAETGEPYDWSEGSYDDEGGMTL